MIKKFLLSFLILLPLCAVADEKPEEVDYVRLSKALGHLIVRQLNQAGFPFNHEQVIQGIRDEISGTPSPMTEEEYEGVVCAVQEQLFMQTAEKNLAAADAFLKENAVKAGIQSLDAKLQYQVAKEGEGEAVGPESVPLIHYQGKLLDGTIFATSESVGEPIALPIKQSIPGFAKGLVGMKEGEKRVLYIHPELAYGLSGQLPPNSLLIFEVEVVKANSINASELAQIAETPATTQ